VREALLYETGDTRRRWMETVLARECAGARLDSFSIAGLVPTTDSLTLGYRFYTSSFALPRSARMTLRPGMVAGTDLADYFRSPQRRHPVRFRFGMYGSVEIRYAVPTGWRWEEPDGADSLLTPFGAYRSSWTGTPGGGVFRRSSVLAGGTVPPEQYTRLREFLDAIRARDAREFALVRH